MFSPKPISKEEALRKIKNFCNYQERSHDEVKQKLYSYGLYQRDVEQLICELIENNFLNEERYAKQYAGGKFRMKQWGRIKIKYELQQKGVNKANIKMGLNEIDEDEYRSTLKKLADTKWKQLGEVNHFTKQAKAYSYLLQKGFERDLIGKVLAELNTEPDNRAFHK